MLSQRRLCINDGLMHALYLSALDNQPLFLNPFCFNFINESSISDFFFLPGVVSSHQSYHFERRLARRCSARKNTYLGRVNKLSYRPSLPNPIKDLQLVVKLHMQLIMHIILQTFTQDEVSPFVKSAKF